MTVWEVEVYEIHDGHSKRELWVTYEGAYAKALEWLEERKAEEARQDQYQVAQGRAPHEPCDFKYLEPEPDDDWKHVWKCDNRYVLISVSEVEVRG